MSISKKLPAIAIVSFICMIVIIYSARVSIFGVKTQAVVMDYQGQGGVMTLTYRFSDGRKEYEGKTTASANDAGWKSGNMNVYYLKSNPQNHLPLRKKVLHWPFIFLFAGLFIAGLAGAFFPAIRERYEGILGIDLK